MFQPKTLEEKVLELKQQNGELVKTAQFWRVQYKKIEEEKLSVMKENTELNMIQQRTKLISQRKKQYFHKIKKRCDMLNELACRSMKDLLQLSSYVEDINDLIAQYDDDTSNRPSGINLSSSSTPSKVHHVRPMIQGVTIKTPVVRVSKTNIDSINRFGLILTNDQTPKRSPVNQKVTIESSPNISLQRLSVSLNRIDPYLERQTLIRMEEDEEANSSESDESFEDKDKSSQENSQYTDAENRSSSYHEEISDCLKYSSRLECIIEESENDNIGSESNLSKRATKRIANDSRDTDDPLEGPSWRFSESNNTLETTPVNNTDSPPLDLPNLNFVTTRKKLIQDESLFDTSSIQKDVEQIPDSTTGPRESESTYGNISNPHHSTPVTCLESENIESNLPKNNESPVKESFLEDEGTTVKVAKPKKSNKGRKVTKKVIKQRVRSLPKTPPKRSFKESTPKMSISRRKQSNRNDSMDSSTSDSMVTETSRPKRGIRKNYKDPDLVKKLRRS